MATERGFGRVLFIGLWVSFVGIIFMYWHAVSSTGELIVVLDELNTRVAEVNATLEELHQELRGTFGGCLAQVCVRILPHGYAVYVIYCAKYLS
jgi:hypothetical protein